MSQYEVATRRTIDAGDELTIDYATNSGDPSFSMECTCGSPLCRGTITAQDWRRPELHASGQRRRLDDWHAAGMCTAAQVEAARAEAP